MSGGALARYGARVSLHRGTLTGQLAAMGFADTGRARRLLTDELGLDLDGADAPLVEALAAPTCARRCAPTAGCATG
jgi:hypothetical protein